VGQLRGWVGGRLRRSHGKPLKLGLVAHSLVFKDKSWQVSGAVTEHRPQAF
jgi:hypothetical protein